MRRYLCTHVEDVLAEQIISGYQTGVTRASISVDENGLRIVCL
jgi:hypothetical protein